MPLSKEMRQLDRKWTAGNGWPRRLAWLEVHGLRGWTGQRIDFSFPIARIVWRTDLVGPPPTTVTVSPIGRATAGVRAQLVSTATEVDALTRAPIHLYRLAKVWQADSRCVAVVFWV